MSEGVLSYSVSFTPWVNVASIACLLLFVSVSDTTEVDTKNV